MKEGGFYFQISKPVFAIMYIILFIKATWDSPKSGMGLTGEI